MERRVLVVGRGRMLIGGLERADPETACYVLEEPELLARPAPAPFASSIVREVRAAPYQRSDALLDPALRWHREVGFHAVVPSMEHAVAGAGLVAQALGLPWLGATCTAHVTNKLRLRRLCQVAGIPHPRFAPVGSAADVRAFFRGRPVVLKPATLQGSVGVLKVQRAADAGAAFDETRRAHDALAVARATPTEYLAEEFVGGAEISVESFVQRGGAVFHNITAKRTTRGRYFVELGHVLPAPLAPAQQASVLRHQERLVAALGARDGFLHAEWKLTRAGPVLIECAGRLAGDYIMDLLEVAYGFNPYLALAQIAAGEAPALPAGPLRGASVRFLTAGPGVVRDVRGLETLRPGSPHLVAWQLRARAGDAVSPLTSSFARLGHVIAQGRSPRAAGRHARALANGVRLVVEASEAGEAVA